MASNEEEQTQKRTELQIAMECSIDGCDKPVRARTWCAGHYQRWARNGSPTLILKIHGDGTGYTSAHMRIYAARGRAAEYDCLHCEGTAAEWAYDHTDPDERVSKTGQEYSLDPSHYFPLCRSCHRKFDGISPQWKAA